MKCDYDCAILGGGPGGLVAALYLRRFQRRVAIFNIGKPRAAWIPKTHNLLGYDHGISGKLLLRKLHRQVMNLNADWIHSRAKVFRSRGAFEIRTPHEIYRARKVILATGIEDVHPQIENLQDLRERGLLRYCSICDGYEHRNRRLIVFAQDYFGIEKAVFLSHWSKRILLVLPKNLKVGRRKQNELEVQRKFKILRTDLFRLLPITSPRGVVLYSGTGRRYEANAAYVELGCKVNDEGFAHLKGLRRSKEGFIIATTEQRTSIPGLFAVGDCVNLLGQISVAAGQAAVAATTIHNELDF